MSSEAEKCHEELLDFYQQALWMQRPGAFLSTTNRWDTILIDEPLWVLVVIFPLVQLEHIQKK